MWCPLPSPCRTDDDYFAALTAAVFQARFVPAIVRARWAALASAFAGFSLATVATWPDEATADLLAMPGVIRSPKKIRATLRNARALWSRTRQYGSVAAYVDSFRPDLEVLVADLDGWVHYVGAPSLRAFVSCAGVAQRWRLAEATAAESGEPR